MAENNLTPEQVVSALEAKVAEATKSFVKSDDITDLKEQLEALKNLEVDKSEMDSMKTAIAKMEGAISALKETPVAKEKSRSLGDAIFKAFAGAKDQMQKLISKEVNSVSLEVKDAGTMTITGNYSGGTVALSDLEQGVARVVRRRPFMRQLSNTRGTTSKYVVYIEQKNPDPNEAGMVAEGAKKPQSDFDLVEVSKEVKKIATFIKVSKEMLADLAFMQGEINGELMELIELKLDEQLLFGNGVGSNLEGIALNAVPYSAGSFAGTIIAPNNSDVIRTAIAQIAQANFQANYIVLNPADVAAMQLTKDLSGAYTYPMFIPQADGITRVVGIPVVENNLVNAGAFFVGDFTKSNLRVREEMNIQVGYVNDDFTKNLITILAEMRAVHFVKSNHYEAFVQGEFAAAKAELLGGL